MAKAVSLLCSAGAAGHRFDRPGDLRAGFTHLLGSLGQLACAGRDLVRRACNLPISSDSSTRATS